jgi:hypothetical protein
MTLFEKWLDRFTERRVRHAAQLTSRRSAVAKLGAALKSVVDWVRQNIK